MSNDIEVLKARYQTLLMNGKNSEGTGVLQKIQRKIWKLEAAQNKQLFLRGVIGNTADSDSAILRSNRSEEAILLFSLSVELHTLDVAGQGRHLEEQPYKFFMKL